MKLPVISERDEDIFTVIQPDICVICDLNKLERRGCTGAPDLIVEILSPHTSKKDLRDKFSLYEESKVPEYWVIYPEEEILEVFKLDQNEQYQYVKAYVKDDEVKIEILNLTIDLTEVFQF